MKDKKILIIGIIIILVVLSGKQILSQKEIAKSPTTAPTSTTISTLYKGTSPCADCPGITIQLTLHRGKEFDEYGTFSMKETYLERNVAPIETNGKWTTDRGSAADEDATVYVLNYDKPDQIQYLLKVDSKTLRNLDNDKKELPPPYNYTLTTE